MVRTDVSPLAAMLAAVFALSAAPAFAGARPLQSRQGMVVSAHVLASQAGADVLAQGGNAVDAAVATAFALAVVHPAAGNIGGGGFLVYRSGKGEAAAYDFRETAPAAAHPKMFLKDGRYDSDLHHESAVSVGVPGSVAGLHLAWTHHGRLPWRRLLEPALTLAREGFVLSAALADSLKAALPDFQGSPGAVAQFSRDGKPYAEGEVLVQKDLAATLERIAREGPDGFYRGRTAELIEAEMRAAGGLVTRADLEAYQARRREPLRGSYRGREVIAMPPPSSGGVALLEMLGVLEGYELAGRGWGSAANVHVIAEAMRRAYADRARWLGDPDFNPQLPLARLLSKPYAASLRASISEERASVSSPANFAFAAEPAHTTHLSVVDAERNAVALTTTLEDNYGSKIVVRGAGFLLNNEMGDFNAAPGLTDETGKVGTEPNLAQPGKRMLSSMCPAIVTRDGRLELVLGSPGGRKIINAVLLTLLNVVDFGMNVQEAVDAPRFHHQWLPDRILHEPRAFSPDTAALLRAKGHRLEDAWPADSPTTVAAIRYDGVNDRLEAGCDRRNPESAAVGR